MVDSVINLVFTNADNIGAHKLVWWHFQVQWGRALTNAAGGIVVRTVTWTEIAREVTFKKIFISNRKTQSDRQSLT